MTAPTGSTGGPRAVHRLVGRLASGGLALGLGLRQARTAEIARVLAVCGYDWAMIDLEHSSMSADTAAQLAVSCEDVGVSPLVRVPRGDHHLATRMLDAGAMGIVFPHVDTAGEAAHLVGACRFPPAGHRSMGGSRLAQLGFRPHDRETTATLGNAATLVVMMIESPEAVANADAIAAVPGVDVVLVGTNDLTLEMGIAGRLGDERVVLAYEAVLAACAAHGKYAGMGGVYERSLMERYIAMGIRFVLAGGDSSILMEGAAQRVAMLRPLDQVRSDP